MICLLAYTEVGQVLKLPILIVHFNEHNAGDHTLKFWNYLREHYLEKDNLPADHERDMQLPFKTFHASQANLVLFAPLQPECEAHVKSEPLKDFLLSNEAYISSAFSGSIFQPPRA
jgi:hypothetical protein